MRYVRSKNDIPDYSHYVIVDFETIHIPGDERSRAQPGHGYPATTDTVCRYIVFDTKEEWVSAIQQRMINPSLANSFVSLVASPARVELGIHVTVETDRIGYSGCGETEESQMNSKKT